MNTQITHSCYTVVKQMLNTKRQIDTQPTHNYTHDSWQTCYCRFVGIDDDDSDSETDRQIDG